MEQRLLEANIAAKDAKEHGNAMLADAIASGDVQDDQKQRIKELVEENARAATAFNEIIESTKLLCDQQLETQAKKMMLQETLFNDQVKVLHDQAKANEEKHASEVKVLSDSLAQTRSEFTQFQAEAHEDFRVYREKTNQEMQNSYRVKATHRRLNSSVNLTRVTFATKPRHKDT